MSFLIRLLNDIRAVKIGTTTGCSARSIARVLLPHGRLVACDVNIESASVARQYWKEAGVDDNIELKAFQRAIQENSI